MATPQLSPGVLIREVDLTVGRADNVLDNIGAIAGPFAIGPVDEPIDITTENQLINVFGKPISTDAQYEYWMSASSFLSYGGVLKVVRTSGENLYTAVGGAGVGTATNTLQIKNYDDYESNYSDDIADYLFAAKTPGSWANNLTVAIIDDKADQIIGIGTTAVLYIDIGDEVSSDFTSQIVSGVGTTSVSTGTLKGVVTGVNTSAGTIDVKVVSIVSGVSTTSVSYIPRSATNSFGISTTIISYGNFFATISEAQDWYDEQIIDLDSGSIYWNSIAPKPTSTEYAANRNCKNDSIHIAVIDDTGSVTGIRGNLLEKHLFLSKASDALSAVNSPQRIWWKDYIALNSEYVYVGVNPSNNSSETTVPTSVGLTTSQGLWNTPAKDKTFSAIGNKTYALVGGTNYGDSGGFKAELGDLMTSYNLFSNRDNIKVDYLIMGPGLGSKYESAAKAQYLIDIADQRKDCMAVISPHRESVVDVTNSNTQTNNIIEFYGLVGKSSSYAVFDSGYKYTYDRFNGKFRYIPCNPDVAGMMVRTNILAYPWFSPAGQQRGVLNNAIKLAYNPSKSQRDLLYQQRVNSIINQPGVGVVLFGDKTALGYASAFDRINVRRLFLTVEQALERTAQAQLFELNDEYTRANFLNIVEPYLRDIQAKRGLYGFLVVCDSTNNTPDVIDNNEFRADIYLKPAKSINYVTLTFVATRTGVSFEEVAGRV